MIKNKSLDIKIIFKIYLKIIKIEYKYFKFSNKLLLYKTSHDSFQKLFFETVFKNNYQNAA